MNFNPNNGNLVQDFQYTRESATVWPAVAYQRYSVTEDGGRVQKCYQTES